METPKENTFKNIGNEEEDKNCFKQLQHKNKN